MVKGDIEAPYLSSEFIEHYNFGEINVQYQKDGHPYDGF